MLLFSLWLEKAECIMVKWKRIFKANHSGSWDYFPVKMKLSTDEGPFVFSITGSFLVLGFFFFQHSEIAHSDFLNSLEGNFNSTQIISERTIFLRVLQHPLCS